ncbi:hypothetical protein FHT32_004786 [Variovorax sp. SG517]|uniref:hypothetical protein n=1 Tax=unclassified Variovorax TaxID=663243 RepID=UPI00159E55EA|nr:MULTISPECIES: hypothetical protein [unclassified Variovorax]NVM91122.1 hypothetical protein [Variovorax sp. SG517]QRY31213.1 hypothetical protein JVX96_24540 [Variovorax sp. PDNC026]
MPEVLKSPTPQAKRQSFQELLEALDYGALAEEATYELNELVHACTETGKVGEIVLAIKIKPVGAGQVELANELKVKKPKPVRGKTLMFATPDNNLQRENPRQQTLDGVRTVAEESRQVRAVT